MKSARNTLPDEPPNALTCGIDWASAPGPPWW